MYEIAQLSRASAAPAKSCTEMGRTSKREKEKKKREKQKQREKWPALDRVNNKEKLVAGELHSPPVGSLLVRK